MLLHGGVHQGRRVLTEKSVRAMTTDHITPAQKAAARFFPGFFDKSGWGYGLRVSTAPDAITPVSGRYGWDGGFGTSWMNDPNRKIVAIVDDPVGELPVQRRARRILAWGVRRDRMRGRLRMSAASSGKSAGRTRARGPRAVSPSRAAAPADTARGARRAPSGHPGSGRGPAGSAQAGCEVGPQHELGELSAQTASRSGTAPRRAVAPPPPRSISAASTLRTNARPPPAARWRQCSRDPVGPGRMVRIVGIGHAGRVHDVPCAQALLQERLPVDRAAAEPRFARAVNCRTVRVTRAGCRVGVATYPFWSPPALRKGDNAEAVASMVEVTSRAALRLLVVGASLLLGCSSPSMSGATGGASGAQAGASGNAARGGGGGQAGRRAAGGARRIAGRVQAVRRAGRPGSGAVGGRAGGRRARAGRRGRPAARPAPRAPARPAVPMAPIATAACAGAASRSSRSRAAARFRLITAGPDGNLWFTVAGREHHRPDRSGGNERGRVPHPDRRREARGNRGRSRRQPLVRRRERKQNRRDRP